MPLHAILKKSMKTLCKTLSKFHQLLDISMCHLVSTKTLIFSDASVYTVQQCNIHCPFMDP